MATTPDGTPFVEPGDSIAAYPSVSQELAAVIDSLRTMIPAGAIFPYAGKLAPEGYLMCDGKAYNRGDFFDLYNVMAEWVGQWGGFPNGDSTLFFVPDFRGRSPIGVASGFATVTAAPEPNANPVADVNLGQRLGDWRVGDHRHSLDWKGSLDPMYAYSASPGTGLLALNTVANTSPLYAGNLGHQLGGVWTNFAFGQDHNRQPSTGVNFIVWTGTTTAGKNPVPGVELAPVTTRQMIETRLEQAGIGEEEIEMLREQLAALKEDTNG